MYYKYYIHYDYFECKIIIYYCIIVTSSGFLGYIPNKVLYYNVHTYIIILYTSKIYVSCIL